VRCRAAPLEIIYESIPPFVSNPIALVQITKALPVSTSNLASANFICAVTITPADQNCTVGLSTLLEFVCHASGCRIVDVLFFIFLLRLFVAYAIKCDLKARLFIPLVIFLFEIISPFIELLVLDARARLAFINRRVAKLALTVFVVLLPIVATTLTNRSLAHLCSLLNSVSYLASRTFFGWLVRVL
jgi:hypothetical protein